MERDLPWRALELPEESPPSSAEDGRTPGAGSPDPRRRVALVALAIAALVAAAIAALFIVTGPGAGALVGDGTDARTIGKDAASGSFAPDAALVAGPGLVIDVAGAVLRPGVYHLPAGSRVGDAIAAAGGFGPRVDALAAQALNLAEPLTDGAQVRVPVRDGSAAQRPASSGGGGNPPGGGAPGARVDLNTATAAELDGLPGIGPVTAGKIIASRTERPFSSVDDLQTRKLVGASTFAKIAGLVAVGGR